MKRVPSYYPGAHTGLVTQHNNEHCTYFQIHVVRHNHKNSTTLHEIHTHNTEQQTALHVAHISTQHLVKSGTLSKAILTSATSVQIFVLVVHFILHLTFKYQIDRLTYIIYREISYRQLFGNVV